METGNPIWWGILHKELLSGVLGNLNKVSNVILSMQEIPSVHKQSHHLRNSEAEMKDKSVPGEKGPHANQHPVYLCKASIFTMPPDPPIRPYVRSPGEVSYAGT